jgi:hypothetical protein
MIKVLAIVILVGALSLAWLHGPSPDDDGEAN